MIAIARMNIPAIFVYGGTIKPGHYDGRDLTVVSAFEAVGQHSAGKIGDRELLEVERRACPGKGSCGGHVHRQHHVVGLRGDGDEPALLLHHGRGGRREGRQRGARRPRRWWRRSQRGLTSRRILTRPAFENAIAVTMALGGSTNAVLHLLAIARAAGGAAGAGRLRGDSRAGAGALRSEAVGALRGHRSPPRRRRASGHEDPARARPAARRGAHDHGPDRGGDAPRDPRRAADGPGSHPPVGPPALPAGTSGRAAGQSRARGVGREDHRREVAADHRAGAGVRVGGALPRGDPRAARSRQATCS